MSRRIRSHERQRCRGDSHKPGCKHLEPPSSGRPAADKRSEAQARRRAREREIRAGLSQDGLGHGSPEKEGINVHEIPPLISHREPHAKTSWRSTSCLCSCHFWSPHCDDKTCPGTVKV